MNSYIAYYNGNKIEVQAESSYSAQLKAAKHFKAKKSYQVSVVLCEVNGETVLHKTSEIG